MERQRSGAIGSLLIHAVLLMGTALGNFAIQEVIMTRADPTKRAVYWTGMLKEVDDYGDRYKGVMIDGKTMEGPWANMTERSWRGHGCGRLGTGFGQKYKKQADGRWLKIEG